MARLSSEESFQRAERIRADWDTGNYDCIRDLAAEYSLSGVFVEKILDGRKCVRKQPPKGNWKPIVLHGVNYLVSDDGRVWSVSMNRLCKQSHKLKTGYAFIKTESAEGVQHKYRVHRLVLTLFDRPPEEGEVGRHLDDDRTNNHISNLAWGTVQDNADDAILNCGTCKGEDIHTSVLTEKLARRLIKSYVSGPLETHAREFRIKHNLPISDSQLVHVLQGKYWAHVVPGFTGYEAAWRQKLDDKAVHAIHANWIKRQHLYTSKHKFYREFAAFLQSKGYDVAEGTIAKAHLGNSFKHIYGEYYDTPRVRNIRV